MGDIKKKPADPRARLNPLSLILFLLCIGLVFDNAADATNQPVVTGIGLQRNADGTTTEISVTDYRLLVAKTGFTRLQATGVKVIVDNGGPIPGASAGPSLDNDVTFGGQRNAQNHLNPATGHGDENPDYRDETGPVLPLAFQGFMGQTNTFQWAKRYYPDGENGGNAGIVFYDVTRAADSRLRRN